MTIEEKAKAYDEAIERAEEMIKAMTNIGGVAKVDDIQYLFPELKESEDEKIRNWLIEAIKQVPNDSIEWETIDKSSVLAWLEKQNEQKPVIEMKTVSESLGFTTQKECDDYNKMVTDLIMSYDGKGEQKPAWTEDDERIILAISQLLKDCESENGWNCVYSNDREVFFADIENWLKSLKDRVGCEVNCTTTWKPSDEQMKQLGWIAKQNKDNMIGKELMSLYQDLKNKV